MDGWTDGLTSVSTVITTRVTVVDLVDQNYTRDKNLGSSFVLDTPLLAILWYGQWRSSKSSVLCSSTLVPAQNISPNLVTTYHVICY